MKIWDLGDRAVKLAARSAGACALCSDWPCPLGCFFFTLLGIHTEACIVAFGSFFMLVNDGT